MSKYTATITWQRKGVPFTDNRYQRSHEWRFDGGATVPASSSPHSVPAPLSDPVGVDPEEAFVASLSSCHMLWFLSLAAKRGFIVDHYEDKAEGLMQKDAAGRPAMTEVILRPYVLYSASAAPDAEEDAEMHREAHEKCFIANSVRTEVRIESSMGKAEDV